MPRILVEQTTEYARYTITDDDGNVIGVDVEHTPTPEQTNFATLTHQALAAFNTNRRAIAATNPTNAQVVAQVKNLSAQNNAIMRLLLGLLGGTD